MSIASEKLGKLRGLKSKSESAPKDSVTVKVPFKKIKLLADVSDASKIAKTVASQVSTSKIIDSSISFDSDKQIVSISFVTSDELDQNTRQRITDATLAMFK
ncbi:structural protein [Yersinia phage vB_Yru_GN1]|uniref:Structural protein n=1 Tax=Yersinia phage vB_Yru_GN1 TaxID=3074381 RepID=A0AA86JHJ9_9CAUD|nr:structural protein [Yersinia phage vB_Yru_GN1]